MGLTGTAFLVTLIVLAVLAPVGLVAGWRHVGDPAAVRWPVRVVGVLVCEALVCAVAVVWLNDANQFYPSWAELFGHVGRLTSPTVSGGQLDRSLGHETGPAHSRLVTVQIPVADEHNTIPATVYLPAAYFEPAYAHRPFPVLELLDGFPGSPESWTHPGSLNVQGILDTEFGSGRAQPFVAVMPEQNFQGSHDGECIDAVGGTQVETTLVADVRSVMTRDFRVGTAAREWSVMGYSTGGFCSVNIVMRHPGLFGSAVSLNGYVIPYVDYTTGPIFGSGTAYRDANDPLWMVEHGNVPRVAVLLAFCDGDAEPRLQAMRFAREVREPLQLSLLHMPGGAHNFPTFRLEEPVAVDWISRHLEYPLAPGVGVRGRTPYAVHEPGDVDTDAAG